MEQGQAINNGAIGKKRCKKCKERVYYDEDILCYYHKKVRDGLIEPEPTRKIDIWGV